MKKIDFFVSHSAKDKEKVDALVSSLEAMGVKCWYAPRDVEGRYAKAICDAIENSKVFLLCLSKNSATSEHVLNEIEMAYSHKRYSNGDINIQPVCIEPIDIDSKDFDEIMYYIRRINFIMPQSNNSSDSIAKEIAKNNKSLFKNQIVEKKERTTSLYFPSERENKRLEIQNKLMRKFDGEIYERIFKSYESPKVLDIGCGNGNVIVDRFGKDNYKLIGIDRDLDKIEEAKRNHAFGQFFKADIESNDFSSELEKIMEEASIDSFDIINISMVLLHLKSQCTLLRILRRVLSPRGILIIKDIDDGINFAYPDDKGDFERIYRICSDNETSGERRNGRQIYTNLIRSGYKNIVLEKQGFSSIGLNYDEKEMLFDLYFKFILGDIKWMHEKYPDNSQIEDDCKWYSDNYDRIQDNFMMEDFVFSIGFQIYTARK